MTQALLVVGGLFVLVYAPLAIVAWRRPLLARFAFREGLRRRSQFALLVVGLMVGSASITASLIAGDSSTQTLSALVDKRLGGADLTVTARGGGLFPVDIARQLAADPALSRYVSGVQGGVEMPASVADLDQRLGRPGVLVVGFDPESQQSFGAYALTDRREVYGRELASGDVLLSGDLAASLDARVGDHLRISPGGGGKDIDLHVYGIAISSGPGAYGSAVAVYMPLATVQQLTGEPGINVVRVAVRRGDLDDVAAARQAAAPLRVAVSRIAGTTPLLVNEVKLDSVRQVEGSTAWILSTTLGFSGFVVLAAIALIVNLVLAIAEERRPRLAVLRALGLTRAGLVALAVIEGAIYSVAAATVGVALGVLPGAILAGQLWNAFAVDPTDVGFLGIPLELTVRPGTLALAFSIGALITLGTVAAAAFRTSRMAIAEAVRDLPEPASIVRNRWPRAALLFGLAALGVALLVPHDIRFRLAGGLLLIIAIAGLLRGRLPDRARYTLTGALLAAWAGVVAAGNHVLSDLGTLVTLMVVGVPVAAIGLTITAAANLTLFDGALGLLGSRFGHLQATLRPPLAYLSRRPLRTGLSASAFALVLVMVTVIAVAASWSSRIDYMRDSMGFDIQAVTQGSDPIVLPSDIAREVTAQAVIPMRMYRGSFNAPGLFGGSGNSAGVMFYVLPDDLQNGGPVYLGDREKRFSSDIAVWRAVNAEPGLVVGEWGAGIAPGERITVEGVDGPLPLRLAGSPVSTILNGMIASRTTLARMETRPAGSTVLLKTRPGIDRHALAREIERSLFAQGVQATTTREILDQDYATNLSYTTEYDLLLHMGLVVGVLALAMVSIRAAIERRRTIGILRALGYQPPRVMLGLVVESALTTTLGAMTGIAAGLVMSYLIFEKQPGSYFGVNFARLGVALAIVYVTVMIVTGPVAWRVSRLAPTEAIRMRA